MAPVVKLKKGRWIIGLFSVIFKRIIRNALFGSHIPGTADRNEEAA